MPRYFFHLTDGASVLDDPDGLDLPGSAAARAEAMLVAADINTRFRPRDWSGWSLRIMDEHGKQIDSFPVTVPPQA
jgi:hypothetical protein